jgi:hypothetical protein
MPLDGELLKARIRAAWGYSGKSQDDLVATMADTIKPGTLRNYLGRTRGQEPSIEDARAIAVACGVPAIFMDLGFDPIERPISDVERRLYELEMRFGALEARQPSAAAIPSPPGELGRRAKGSSSNGKAPSRSAKATAADARKGTSR